MVEKILLGEDVKSKKKFELDSQELITGRTLLCSISRYGKTWTARRIVEQVFGKTGLILVDVEGEYSTLRDKFPFLIIGRDVPLVPESAEFLADQILEHDLSAIIDGSDPQLDVAAFQEFLARFIDRFIAVETHARKPYLWILEEADELAPETGIARSICLGQVRKLVKKGGKRGLGTMVLTQRPAFVSKFVISQCPNKIIGRTEWPDDLAVLRKFGRIPEKLSDPESKDPYALKSLDRGEFYVTGDFAERSEIVKVGPVQTQHLGATPLVVPPAPKELKDVLAQLSERLPKIIQEKLVPAVPKVAEIEARLKEKFEAQWQARLARKDKELGSIKNKLEAKYETEIADLKRKLDEAQKAAALKEGPIEDLLSHPLVKGRLEEKLSPQERSLVQLLERKGPQNAEQAGLYLGVKPKSVSVLVSTANKKMPGLIESDRGRYVSRLAKLFPVTEELKAEAKEIESLRSQLADRMREIVDLKNTIQAMNADYAKLNRDLQFTIKERNDLAIKLKEVESRVRIPPAPSTAVGAIAPSIDETRIREIVREELSAQGGPGIPVDVTLKRTLGEFNVSVSKEVLEVDESSWIGKLLARGVAGFFSEEQGFGAIMSELERVYSASRTSGGTRDAVQKALEELCAKGILERESKANQWMYKATEEFKERVKRA